MELGFFKELLASGADAAIIVFAFLLWKLDRRLLMVELQIESLCRPRKDNHD